MTRFNEPFCTDRATLFSLVDDPECHRMRILLAEKEAPVRINVMRDGVPSGVQLVNRSKTWPLLTDKALALWSAEAIEGYINERFPEPVILPGDPIARAMVRQAVAEIRGWYTEPLATTAQSRLTDLTYMCHDTWLAGKEFSLIDIALAPWLWRALAIVSIDRVPHSHHLRKYAERLFSRRCFVEGTTREEASTPVKSVA